MKDREDYFTKWIDSSLNNLSDIDINASDILIKLNVLRSHVEQALCHAMSIAQIVQNGDGENIKNYCKQVSLIIVKYEFPFVTRFSSSFVRCN